MKNLIYVEFMVEKKKKKIYKIVKKSSTFPVNKENDFDVVVQLDNIEFDKFVDKINPREIIRWKDNRISLENTKWNIKLASYQEVIIEEGNNEGFKSFNDMLKIIESMV